MMSFASSKAETGRGRSSRERCGASRRMKIDAGQPLDGQPSETSALQDLQHRKWDSFAKKCYRRVFWVCLPSASVLHSRPDAGIIITEVILTEPAATPRSPFDAIPRDTTLTVAADSRAARLPGHGHEWESDSQSSTVLWHGASSTSARKRPSQVSKGGQPDLIIGSPRRASRMVSHGKRAA